MFNQTRLPGHVKDKLATWVNHSKANGTWSTYRTAERMALLCQKETKTTFEWPMTTENTLLFVYWLIEERKLKVATVNSYLAGIRQVHIMKGLPEPKLREELVKQALKGRRNMEAQGKNRTDTTAKRRIAMTIPLMKLLKERIRTADLEKESKLMLWTVSTLLFFGAFRISELVSIHESTFDPDHTLLGRDVQLVDTDSGRVLSITLKCPKERAASDATIVDIFESGGSLCPIKAFSRWQTWSSRQMDMPLFRAGDGTPLTCRKYNELLKKMLDKHAHFSGGSISAHSFRAGITTILGTKGFSDDEIKLVGRWSSRAFEIYMKGHRTKRALLTKKLGELD